ncbi:hypothetical protein AB0B92_13720 [Streptomyces hygroscopicus]|uniref:hypothetical protein n=1 Tax=Streptomyces hygroscopicus TaxID=1912 RepID=UPI00340B5723
MQMTPEQLIEEYRDTVLELHLTRRHLAALEAENASLRAQLAPAEDTATATPTTRTTATRTAPDQAPGPGCS